MPTKPRIVFVGAFKTQAEDGTVGGQLYACRTLLASPLSDHIDWVLLDTTMESLPPPPLQRRAWLALRRLLIFTRHMLTPSIAGALIFTSGRFSFLEKGTMVHIAALFGKQVALFPRSGLILDDIQRSDRRKRFVRNVLRKCDTILCQSESWKTIFQDLTDLPDEKFQIRPNWIDLTPYAANTAPQQPIQLLYMGWLEPHKGIWELVHAIAAQQDTLRGKATLVVCGSGALDTALREYIAAQHLQDLIEFRGWVTGLAKQAVLAESDVLVLPSHLEGFPNILLESMASGLAIIATRVGAIPEVLGTRNEIGILIDAKSEPDLERAIVNLVSQPEQIAQMGVTARHWVETRYSIETAWEQMQGILIHRPRQSGGHAATH